MDQDNKNSFHEQIEEDTEKLENDNYNPNNVIDMAEDKADGRKAQAKDDKKVKKLEKALEKTEQERDALKDSYQRTFSEFNNYKKRNQALATQSINIGVCDTIEKILPVIDNFERALEHADDVADKAFAQGVLMVYRQLCDILTAMGVKEIPALGEQFDPNLHQAIQQVDAPDGEPANTIVNVVQKGYVQGEKIIRHSMVIVSK